MNLDAVVVEGLTKVFRSRTGEVRAADGVSFRVPRGVIFGLLGPNGAGKTTTLRMLATILRPTSGRAWIEGSEVAEQPDHVRRKIGYMSCDTGLYGRLTPREMIHYFGRLYGMAEDRLAARCEEILRRLGIGDFADKPNDKLSSGMKQKVSIARTIVHDPPVLILDEPTAALDVLASRVIVDFVREAKSAGKTVVFSSHNMLQAEKLSDVVAIIHRGCVRAHGTLDQLRAQTGLEDLEDIFVKIVDSDRAAA